MGKNIQNRIFIDTNVLINDFFFREEGTQLSRHANNAISFLRSKPKVSLFIASFSIVQVVSTLSKAKIPDQKIRNEIKIILSKYEIIEFTASDIAEGLNQAGADVEDAFQYVVSRKLRCYYVITDNAKDFRHFKGIVLVKPEKVRTIVFI